MPYTQRDEKTTIDTLTSTTEEEKKTQAGDGEEELDFVGGLLSALGFNLRPQKKEAMWNPKTDERGLMTDVEELRDLANLLTGMVKDLAMMAVESDPLAGLRVMGLVAKASAAHDLVCDCHRREEKKA